jgi:transposase
MSRTSFVVTPEDRAVLLRWIRGSTTPQRIALRARIILLASEGRSNRAIARELSISPHTVTLWRKRYEANGPLALQKDAPGRGRRATLQTQAAARLKTLLARGPDHEPRWTVRRLAEAIGVSRATLYRIRRTLRDETGGIPAVRTRVHPNPRQVTKT